MDLFIVTFAALPGSLKTLNLNGPCLQTSIADAALLSCGSKVVGVCRSCNP